MNKQSKLEKFAVQELRRNKNILIMPDDSGGYVAFDRYHIRPQKTGFEVMSRSYDRISLFSNQRVAMGWCVADKFNHITLASSIKNLDSRKQQLSAHIATVSAALRQSKDSEFEEVVETKLSESLVQFRSVCEQLDKCVNSAKYLQLKGFQNEIERPYAS